jgi:non-ribosomal peptide synthetase component F
MHSVSLHWSGALREFRLRTGITPATVTRIAITLAFGARDIVLGIVRSGRDLGVADAEDIVGPCVSVLPARMRLSPSQSLSDLLRAETESDIEARRHQDITLPELVRLTGMESRNSLFDILVTFQNFPKRPEPRPIEEPPEKIVMPTTYRISVEVTPTDDEGELDLHVYYDAREQNMEAFLERVAHLLTAIVSKAESGAKVGDLVNIGEEANGDGGHRDDNGEDRGEGDALQSTDPGTELRDKVRAAWSKVLNVDASEIDDNSTFKSLGGDSVRLDSVLLLSFVVCRCR